MANSKRLMASRTYSGTFPSPETPPCGEEDSMSTGIPKGWSSERVPRSSYRSRRYVAAAALMPLSSGSTLPSKWEDAERWICSPVSLGNMSTNSNYYYGSSAGSRTVSQLAQYRRRAKSKSGPLGPVGPASYAGGYNSFSPVLGVGVINGGRWRNSLAIEPSGLASARFEERLPDEGGGSVSEEGRRSCPGQATHWLDTWSGPPSPSQGEVHLTDENNEGLRNNLEQESCNICEPRIDRAVSRRDMATQMFPESESSSTSSIVSSPKSPISATSPRPLLLNEHKRDVQTPESEVKDVQVDKQSSVSRSRLNAHNVRDDYSNSSTSIEADNIMSKFERNEARINAWENLQKAKAEAAIQKLEEKLEKKRTSSMDKIIQKLRRAEVKAEKMRNALPSDNDRVENQAISKTSSKIPLICKKIKLKSLSRSCTTCYPF